MQGIEVFILLAMAGLLGWFRSNLNSKQTINELRSELEVEKKMRALVEHQLEIAEKEIMCREGLDQMKDTYIKIQKQEKDLMKWQAEQGGGEMHD